MGLGETWLLPDDKDGAAGEELPAAPRDDPDEPAELPGRGVEEIDEREVGDPALLACVSELELIGGGREELLPDEAEELLLEGFSLLELGASGVELGFLPDVELSL